MSINQSISNAFSGLSAASRASEIVSRNIANASTEGYSATVVNRSQQIFAGQGAGVKVDGIERSGNPLLTADRRRADGVAAKASGEAQLMRQLADLVNDPHGGASLSSRFIAFENALRGLADTPESAAMQSTVARAGRSLAKQFNIISTETTRVRTDIADDVQRQVKTVNGALKKIAQLNTQIAAASAAGQDTTALEDARDRQIETVNDIIPINARDRKEGGMMIASRGGALLVEGSPREIEYSVITDADGRAVDYTFKVDGFDVGAVGDSARLGGGGLEASMKALQKDIPAFMEQVNLLAADLVERFQTLPGYETIERDGLGDPVLGPEALDGMGNPIAGSGREQLLKGLFTAGGEAFAGVPPRGSDGEIIKQTNPADDLGTVPAPFKNYDVFASLASTIQFNTAFDPLAGGDASALQTGDAVGGLAADPAADPAAETFPTALMTAMRASVASEIPGVSGNFNAVDMAIGLMGIREVDAQSFEDEASFQQAAASSMRDEEHATKSVDTDAELRDLLRIEQAYQANARVIEAANNMINRLLEM